MNNFTLFEVSQINYTLQRKGGKSNVLVNGPAQAIATGQEHLNFFLSLHALTPSLV
jgi:hypothetical protein